MPYPGHATEEIARLGREIYERDVRAKVESEHAGRFIVVDVKSGDYEVADDDLTASDRMVELRPEARLYGIRIGHRAAYRIGHSPGPDS